MVKKVLIFSIATIPFDEETIVAGAGMRTWFLASGLRDNDIEVTVALPPEVERPADLVNGINVVSWEFNQEFKDFMNSFDSVLLQYTRPDITNYVADHIDLDVQLIIDLYIPAFVEVSARDSEDKDTELKHFLHDVYNWNKIIRMGDLFLVANENQEKFYEGVLSALSRLNPVSYAEDYILKVPLGVQNETLKLDRSISKVRGATAEKDDFIFMWFGSLYPWFDITDVLYALKEVNKKTKKNVRFVIIGAINPKETREEFVKQGNELMQLIESDKEIKEIVIMQDWVKYNERHVWFNDADAFITINKNGRENKYAWRTRTTDLIASEKPIISNGEDPISDYLEEFNALYKFKNLEVKEIEKVLLEVVENDSDRKEKTANVKKVKESLIAKSVLEKLVQKINSGYEAPDYKKILWFENENNKNKENKLKSFLKKVKRKLT